MPVKKSFLRRLIVGITGALALSPMVSVGQDSSERILEEIIVTATMREESLQDVPLSIATLSSEDIKSVGAFRMQDLNGIIPNVNVREGVIDNAISIRGIGSGNNQAFEQSVGIFRDGIYVGKPTLSRLPFLDMSGLEVVRGPQGVLFGRSTIAGAITQSSNGPTDEVEIGGRTQIALDGDEDYVFEGFVSGPLTDNFRGRLAMRYRDSDGYVANEATGENLPKREEYGLRGSLEWDISESITTSLKVEHSDTENNGTPMDAIGFFENELQGAGQIFYGGGLLDPADYQLDFVTNIANLPNQGGTGASDLGPDGAVLLPFGPVPTGDDFTGFVDVGQPATVQDADAQLVSFKIEAELGDFQVQSITGYAAYEQFFIADPGDPLPLVNNRQTEDYSQFSQEVRLLSPEADRLNWIAGVYYETNDFNYTEQINVGPFQQSWNTFFNQDEENISLFGQATFSFTDTLVVTGGVRYSNTEKDVDFEIVVSPLGSIVPVAAGSLMLVPAAPHVTSDSRSEESVDWLVSLEKQFSWAGEHTAYVTVSKGSKAGGFNARALGPEPPGVSPGDIGAFQYNKEEADSYELGLKSLWLDGALAWNWAIYYAKFENLQASLFNGVAGFNVANAPENKVHGFETDLNWALSDGLSIWANAAYLNDEVQGFPQPANFGPLNGDVTATAEWQGATGFRYRRPMTDRLDFIASATFSYIDDVITGDPLRLERASYRFDSVKELDFQVGVGSNDGTWTVNLLGSNVTDETSCFFVSAAAFTDGALPVCLVNPPRTFYLQASYNY